MRGFLKSLFYALLPIRLYLFACRMKVPDSELGIPKINTNRFFQLLSSSQRSFIQIGANDGVKNDPIYSFVVNYRWQGVLVEPLPDFFARLQSNYSGIPGLRFENSGISDKDGHLEFYYLPPRYSSPEWLQQIGSFSKEAILLNLKDLPEFIPHIESDRIPVLTLNQLFAKYSIRSVDLLLIDAEGFEGRILKGLALSSVRPRFIFYEWGCMSTIEHRELMNMLKGLGYALYASQGDILAVK